MNLSEFKAWFEGFTENMDGPPNREQWKKIRAKVKKIDDTVTTWPIFVDRYIRPYPRPWGPYWASSTASSCEPQKLLSEWSATEAFKELGRIESQN